jgi:AcrR family transcriptional regulator
VTSRRPQQRPDQILDAAEGLLAGGAAELNMDHVAQAAGLSKGTVYHYYAAKTDLLHALRERHLRTTVGRSLEAASSAAGTFARLETFIRALLDDAVVNGPLVWALFHDTGTTGNPYLTIVGDALRGLIHDGVAAGDLAIDDVDAVATFFVHGCYGRIQDAFHAPSLHPAELAGELTTLLRRLVTPVAPAGEQS